MTASELYVSAYLFLQIIPKPVSYFHSKSRDWFLCELQERKEHSAESELWEKWVKS